MGIVNYAQLKRIDIDKEKETVHLTTSIHLTNSNDHPLYTVWEYEQNKVYKSLSDKLHKLCKECIEGEYVPLKNCNMGIPDKIAEEEAHFSALERQYPYLNTLYCLDEVERKYSDMGGLVRLYKNTIIRERANYLYNEAFAKPLELDEIHINTNWAKLNDEIADCFDLRLEDMRKENFEQIKRGIGISLCQIAPKIGLEDMVSYFGDYDMYEPEVCGKYTEKDIWNAVVEHLNDMAKANLLHMPLENDTLMAYPPKIEKVAVMEQTVKKLEKQRNELKEIWQEYNSKLEKDEMEEER